MTFSDSIAKASRKLVHTRFGRVSEALRRYYPARAGTTTVHDFDGNLSICLDRSKYVGATIYWRGNHSTHIAEFMKRYLRPEMTFVDIGANQGELTLIAAKRLSKGQVLAFEPMPNIFAQLAHNVNLNGFSNVRLFPMGLFDRDGSLPMYVKNDIAFGRVNEGVPSLFSTGSDRRELSVPLRRFDDVARECGLARLDVMKIDVEGAEMMALRGAERSIREFRPVIIAEISEPNFRRAGYTTQDLTTYLGSLGYDIRSLDDSTGALSSQCDAVCFPEDGREELQVAGTDLASDDGHEKP